MKHVFLWCALYLSVSGDCQSVKVVVVTVSVVVDIAVVTEVGEKVKI